MRIVLNRGNVLDLRDKEAQRYLEDIRELTRYVNTLLYDEAEKDREDQALFDQWVKIRLVH